jgi:hypothetical protein
VYGVELHPSFTWWLEALHVLNFDPLRRLFPASCLGSMAVRLLVGALWPYAAVGVGVAALACHQVIILAASARAAESDRDEPDSSSRTGGRNTCLATRRPPVPTGTWDSARAAVRTLLFRSLYALILVLYIVLPSVSRSIFAARLCQSFGTDDLTGQRSSYLVADWSVLCEQSDAEFAKLQVAFWVCLVLWSVLLPIAGLALTLVRTPPHCI